MATRQRKRSVGIGERSPVGRIMKRENPVGFYGVTALINDVMDKYNITLKEVSSSIPCLYTNIWGIYHGKRAAPWWIVSALAKMIHSENHLEIASNVMETERIKKADRIAAAKEADEDPDKPVRKERKKKVE